MRTVEENWKHLASSLLTEWQQMALQSGAIEQSFRTYFASLALSVIHVIARVAAGSPNVLIARTAT
jgi:hypothetical protein